MTPADIGAQPAGNYQPAGDYKTKQTAVTAQNLSGATVIKSVSQDTNGVITVATRDLTAADLGLDTVMHFIGAYATAPTKAFAGTADERALADGDVYLNTANNTEYVYSGGKWNELGNEGEAGSHAYKTVKVTANEGLTGGGTLAADMTIGIAASGVTTVKIADDAVTADKLADAINTDIAKGVAAKTQTDKLKGLAFQDKIDNSDIDDGAINVAKLNGFNAAVAAVKVTNAGNADTLGTHAPEYLQQQNV